MKYEIKLLRTNTVNKSETLVFQNGLSSARVPNNRAIIFNFRRIVDMFKAGKVDCNSYCLAIKCRVAIQIREQDTFKTQNYCIQAFSKHSQKCLDAVNQTMVGRQRLHQKSLVSLRLQNSSTSKFFSLVFVCHTSLL